MLRYALTIALAVLTTSVAVDSAAARQRHRHHASVAGGHQFVYPTPQAAARAGAIGEFAGDFVTGIPAAVTADPYEHPIYGYNQRGVYGPGYAYPGY